MLAISLIRSLGVRLVYPLGVIYDARFVAIEYFKYLFLIGRGIGNYLFAGQRLRVSDFSGGIADTSGKIANQKNNFMAEILKAFQFAQNDRMSEM